MSSLPRPGAALALLLLVAGPEWAHAGWPTAPVSKPAWRRDLQVLAEDLPRRHRNLYHSVTREAFARAVAELDSRIARLDDDAIAVGLMRIVAMAGDGHTVIRLPPTRDRYPLVLSWFDSELRVTATTPACREALGTSLVQIGDASIAEAYERVSSLVPHGENAGWVEFSSTLRLVSPEVLHGLGLVSDKRRAPFTFERADGVRFSVELSPFKPDERIHWIEVASERPLYRERTDQSMWLAYLPDSETVYFAFNRYPESEAFQRHVTGLFTALDRRHPRRLVIDLRHNGGGDFTLTRRWLLPGLEQRLARGTVRELFVIIGPGTFSAAMINALDLRREAGATLVGEPTGARPNSYSENREFGLPYSGLRVSYATRYYRFVEDDPPAVMPDQIIVPSWEDWTSGRDPVLEWITRP